MKRFLLLALCALFALNAEARTLYVDARQPNNSRNGRSLKNAKKTIQAAINVAKNGDTILVYPGTYGSIKTNNRKIIVKSAKGCDQTTIEKRYAYGANWCLNLGKWSGNTFKGGKTTKVFGVQCVGGGSTTYKGCGAVIGGTVRNCSFDDFGGRDSWIGWKNSGSSNPRKGKVVFFKSKLSDCFLRQCYQGTEVNVLMAGCSINRVEAECCAGRIYKSTLANSLFHGGRTGYFSTRGSSADETYGPLFDKSKIYNSTIVRVGPGRFLRVMEGCKAWNCVFWDTPTTIFSKRKKLKNSFSNCYEGGPNPGFVQSGSWDYPDGFEATHYYSYWYDSYYGDRGDFRLTAGSRCIDAGRLTKAQKKLVGTKDLFGNKRIKGRAIDMGCYEY